MERLDLKVGFGCNNNCVFCAQANRKKFGDNSTSENKENLKKGYEKGKRKVVFTGGEPLIRDDIFELLDYARELGYKSIQVQTNARMLAYPEFARKIVNVVDEVVPALHGPNQEIHDSQTRAKGSFDQTVSGIKNLANLREKSSSSVKIYSNTVVNQLNYEHMPETADKLIELGVDQFQLAFIHYVGAYPGNPSQIVPKKSEVRPYIHRALDKGIEKNVDCMVEAYPYCFMQGYESHVSQLYIPETEIRGQESYVGDETSARVSEGKSKFDKCSKCKFFKVCEGPWKEYPEIYGQEEFEPVKGEKVEASDIIDKRRARG